MMPILGFDMKVFYHERLKKKSTKHQHPSTRETPNFKLQTMIGDFIGAWSLEFLWSLELGIWSFSVWRLAANGLFCGHGTILQNSQDGRGWQPSDVHIKIGTPVIFRINRELISIECPVPTEQWMNN